MECIDPHMHLWDLEENYYPWLCDVDKEDSSQQLFDLTPLRKSYRIADYIADTERQYVVKAVHVDAKFDEKNPIGETRWLQAVADNSSSRGMPNGIVAFVNLGDGDAEETIAAHAQYPNLRGIRHMLNRDPDIADRDYLLDEKWCANFSLMRKYDLIFDLQLYHPQMADAAALARRYRDVTISLNHAGMPHHPDAEGFNNWRQGMALLADCDNIVAKISGLGMTLPERDAKAFRPYVLETIELFGVDRCMFASNFPVDRLYTNFDALWSGYKEIVQDFSADDRKKLFHDNAERTYRI
jgi:predicted TIM-barrel fold metal-dependent hydrolase